jgi:hypothetical protein
MTESQIPPDEGSGQSASVTRSALHFARALLGEAAGAAPVVSDEQIEELAHRMAFRYKQLDPEHKRTTFLFTLHTLIPFARSILAASVAPAPVAMTPEQQPLTQEQIDDLFVSKLAGKGPFVNMQAAFTAMVRAIEAAHGIGAGALAAGAADLREALHLIASTTTDRAAREEALRALAAPGAPAPAALPERQQTDSSHEAVSTSTRVHSGQAGVSAPRLKARATAASDAPAPREAMRAPSAPAGRPGSPWRKRSTDS